MKILNKWTCKVIFENQKETIKETVEGANLIDANLRGANGNLIELSFKKD